MIRSLPIAVLCLAGCSASDLLSGGKQALLLCVESANVPIARRCGETVEVDLGGFRVGEARSATVTLHNAGADPLVITHIALEEGAHPAIRIVAAQLPAVLAPNELLSVGIELAPADRGAASATLAIETNDPRHPIRRVPITGAAVTIALCVDPDPIHFGRVAIGRSEERTLNFLNCGEQRLQLSGIDIDAGEFSIDGGPVLPVDLDPGVGFAVALRYAPIEEGADQGRIHFLTAEGAVSSELFGLGAACVLAAEPPELDLDAAIGETQQARVIFSNTGAQSCAIAAIRFAPETSGELSLEIPQNPDVLLAGETIAAVIVYRPIDLESDATQLFATGEGSNEPIVSVPVRGAPSASPCALEVWPAALSFGVVSPGEALAQSLNFELRDGACSILSASIDGEGFVIASAPLPALIGDAAPNVSLRFAPVMPGVFRGSLELLTTDTSRPRRTIALYGESRAPRLCVDPADVDFGSVATTSTQTIHLHACGGEPVEIRAIEWRVPDDELQFTSDFPIRLAPGENTTVMIRYSPIDQSGDTAILRVRSDDPLRSEINLRVTAGRALVPAAAARFLYYWRIQNPLAGDAAVSDVLRFPLQGASAPELFRGPSITGNPCSGCHVPSPDGRYVAVIDAEEGANGHVLHRLSITDTIAGRTFTARSGALWISWNPDVTTRPAYQYVYSSGDDLHLASIEAGELGPLEGASDPAVTETMPSWGADQQIVFVRALVPSLGFGLIGESDLMIVAAAGGSAMAVPQASGGGRMRAYPAIAPNGRFVAFTESTGLSFSAADAQVRLIDLRAGVALPSDLLNEVGAATSFANWSRDGRYLAFGSDRAGRARDLYLAPIDPATGVAGEALPIVELNTEAYEHGAQWSP